MRKNMFPLILLMDGNNALFMQYDFVSALHLYKRYLLKIAPRIPPC